MPTAQVSSYTSHVGRLGALGTDRLLVLKHAGVDGSHEAASEIYFSDRFAESTSGFTTMGGADSVRAHLPADDYAVWVDLLRHEAPVFLHWSIAAEAGTPDPDGIIHLGTGPEPIGEGPVDVSPYAE